MNFDYRSVERIESIEDRHRGVGKCRRIDRNAGGSITRLVNPVDDLVFAVALAELDFQLQLGCQRPARRLDIGEGFAPVDLRLAFAEQVEVGTVEDVDETAHQLFSDDAGCLARFRATHQASYAAQSYCNAQGRFLKRNWPVDRRTEM